MLTGPYVLSAHFSSLRWLFLVVGCHSYVWFVAQWFVWCFLGLCSLRSHWVLWDVGILGYYHNCSMFYNLLFSLVSVVSKFYKFRGALVPWFITPCLGFHHGKTAPGGGRGSRGPLNLCPSVPGSYLASMCNFGIKSVVKTNRKMQRWTAEHKQLVIDVLTN